MAPRIGRTLPPAAAPLDLKDILYGFFGFMGGIARVSRFEEELRNYFNVSHCFAVSSGKAALVLILQALHDLKPERNEVLIPAYTCYSVPSAIVRAGLKVRLCDLAYGNLDFDFERFAEQVEKPRLLCVIPTHLFGLPADVCRAKNVVNNHGIFVVEDAAQAMGAEWNGRKLGTAGDVGLFSMGRGKAFSTVEGGIILTGNKIIGEAIAKRLTAVDGYGAFDFLKLVMYAVALTALVHPRIYWLPKMLPFLKLGETHYDPSFPIRRLSPFQAGLAKGWKDKIRKLRQIRAGNTCTIADCGLMLPGDSNSVIPELIRYPVLISDADTKRKILLQSEKMGLGISDGYPNTIDKIGELGGTFEGNRFTAAKDIAERIVSLPVHPYVSERDIQRIVRVLTEPYEQGP